MKSHSEVQIDRHLNVDELIVIAGSGGFIAGSMCRYFHELGFTGIPAIDRKPLPEWYQRVPGVKCLSMDPGMERTYAWIAEQFADRKAGKRVVTD